MSISPYFQRDPADSYYTDNYPELTPESYICYECGSACTAGEDDGMVICANDETCGLWWTNRADWARDKAQHEALRRN